MKIDVLKGNSGCDIYSINIFYKKFVIKVSSGINFNNTLKEQQKKQKQYSKIFRTPKIIISGFIPFNCKYFILMEYIHGNKLSDIIFLSDSKYGEKILHNFLNIYTSNIKLNFTRILILNNIIFKNKIENVFIKLEELNFSHSEKLVINKTMNLLKDHDWSFIQKSKSHGDLTLENVIFYNDEFVLIDFLNCFYDSWELDISKLLFDIRIGWSLRYDYMLIDKTKKIRKKFYKIIMRRIFKNIRKYNYYQVKNDLIYLQLLHGIRILPYIKDNSSKEIILNGLKDIIKEL